MRNILRRHALTHPAMTAQDAIKLCYQATFGAEHLLQDRDRAFAYFMREWDALAPEEISLHDPTHDIRVNRLCEPISPRYARVHLMAWKYGKLPPQWLFDMFFRTASEPSGLDAAELNLHMDTVAELAAQGALPFTAEDWLAAREAYEQSGGGAVHHSENYRAAEHPAYRVVDRRYTDLIPLLIKLNEAASQKDAPITVAIDGRAASGKSTLAHRLAEILGAGIVHMDDFFLPPALRTAERLAAAGGNVHHERFATDVLPYLRSNESFTYPVFNCSKMQLDGERSVDKGSWRIVEGSYSHHPGLGAYMDLKVFVDVSPGEQMRRILARNGEDMAKMFADRWIPMEELYFKTYCIQESADLTITNEQGEKQ